MSTHDGRIRNNDLCLFFGVLGGRAVQRRRIEIPDGTFATGVKAVSRPVIGTRNTEVQRPRWKWLEQKASDQGVDGRRTEYGVCNCCS